MDCYNTSDLISIEQALDKLLTQTSAITDREDIALTEAAGRITA